METEADWILTDNESYQAWLAGSSCPYKFRGSTTDEAASTSTWSYVVHSTSRAKSSTAIDKSSFQKAALRAIRDVIVASMQSTALGMAGVRGTRVFSAPSEVTEADPVRKTTISLFSALASVKEERLDWGTRLETAASMIDRHLVADPKVARDAIGRVLFCSSDSLSDEVRAALVRYLAMPNVTLSLSWRTSLFVSLIESESEEQSVAAVRSLEEIGNVGVVPALKAARAATRSPRLKWQLKEAVETIESLHGPYSNSSS